MAVNALQMFLVFCVSSANFFLTVAINGKDTKRRGDNDVFLAFYEEKRSEFDNVIIKSE